MSRYLEFSEEACTSRPFHHHEQHLVTHPAHHRQHTVETRPVHRPLLISTAAEPCVPAGLCRVHSGARDAGCTHSVFTAPSLLVQRRQKNAWQFLLNIDLHTPYRHYTHPFSGPLSGTTQGSRYQKGETIWILLKQESVSGSGISWTICKSAPRSRQITTPAPHYSAFTGRMLFLPPNQQRQSTEGNCVVYKYFCYWCRIVVLWTRMCSVCLLQLYPPTGCKYVTTKSLIETSCWSQLHSRQ